MTGPTDNGPGTRPTAGAPAGTGDPGPAPTRAQTVAAMAGEHADGIARSLRRLATEVDGFAESLRRGDGKAVQYASWVIDGILQHGGTVGARVGTLMQLAADADREARTAAAPTPGTPAPDTRAGHGAHRGADPGGEGR